MTEREAITIEIEAVRKQRARAVDGGGAWQTWDRLLTRLLAIRASLFPSREAMSHNNKEDNNR